MITVLVELLLTAFLGVAVGGAIVHLAGRRRRGQVAGPGPSTGPAWTPEAPVPSSAPAASWSPDPAQVPSPALSAGAPARLDRDLIATFPLPPGLLDRALERCPAGTRAATLETGLREFLAAAGWAMAQGRTAGMPSRAVDEAWHELVLYTREYEQLCQQAFGRMLHHQPEVAMSAGDVEVNRTEAMARTWDGACLHAGLDPHTTPVAPVLFSADREAGVPGAPEYVATCGRQPCARTADQVCVAHDLRSASAPVTPVVFSAPSRRSRARTFLTGRGGRSGGAGAGWSGVYVESGGHHGGGHHGCGSSGCGGGGGGCGGGGCGGGGCGGGS